MPPLPTIHLLAAILALIVAPIAMATRKGADAHRRWGMVFVWALVVVALSGITISILDLEWHHAMVAVFSFHLAGSGLRSLRHKRLHEGQKPRSGDVVLQATVAVVYGAAFIWGLINWFLGHRDADSFVFILFGGAGLLVAGYNMHRFYKRSHDKREWLYGHMAGMVGAYILTLCAFSASELTFIKPLWLRFSWPLLLGLPALVQWMKYYKTRFSRGRRSRDLFELRIPK